MPRRDAVPGVAGAGAAAARISCQRHDWPPAFFLPVQEWPLPFSFGSLPAMPYSASRRSISCQISAGRMPISDSRTIQLYSRSTDSWITSSRLLVTHSSDTRSEEHTSELQSLMRRSYPVFCLKKKKTQKKKQHKATPQTNQPTSTAQQYKTQH